MGNGVVNVWTICNTSTDFCMTFHVYALQKTDNLAISAMDVPGHIVSLVNHERCTAILVGAMMILSVYLPHSGFDEEDYFAMHEAVRNVMDEGKKLEAVDFFIGGDINVELKLSPGDEDLQGLDGIQWYGIYGPECLGGGEDVTTYEKKLWWLQLLREFDCTVTSTWVDAENLGECHTWRAWGSRVRKKHLDYFLEPRTTWDLNKTRIRTWDHSAVVVKIEEREMRVRKRKKGWTGWTPVSVDEERKFKERCLCPEGSRSWCGANEVSGLEALQARQEGTVVEVKATTLATRNNKFTVPEEIRELASVAAQCRDLGLEEEGTESAQRIRCQCGGPAKRQCRQETCGDEALGQRQGY